LPYGVGIYNDPGGVSGSPSFGANPPGGYSVTPPNPVVTPETTGIFGASYTAAAGLLKNLVGAAINAGATPPTPANRGFDGADNDGNGLVDDLGENGASVQKAIITLLGNHTHK